MCELIYLGEGRIDDVSICQDAMRLYCLKGACLNVCVCMEHKKGRHN